MKELIKFKDLIKFPIGLIDLIKDLIEVKNMFESQFWQNFEELINSMDLIILLMGFVDSIMDSIEEKIKFGCLNQINSQRLKD